MIFEFLMNGAGFLSSFYNISGDLPVLEFLMNGLGFLSSFFKGSSLDMTRITFILTYSIN